MKVILILLALDPFCLKVPSLAWHVSVETAVYVAKNTYGVEEPYLSRLRACLHKPQPVAK